MLKEHTVFSKQNVIFLQQSILCTAPVQPLSAELRRNLDEELGYDEEHGENHYELYIKGLKEELGIDVTNYLPSYHTSAFMGRMLELSNSGNVEIACGAIFASEAAAVPELELMRSIASSYSKQVLGHDIEMLGLLKNFYDMHLSGVEQAHREGLAHFIREYEKYGLNLEKLQSGFHNALNGMSKWWDELISSTQENRDRRIGQTDSLA